MRTHERGKGDARGGKGGERHASRRVDESVRLSTIRRRKDRKGQISSSENREGFCKKRVDRRFSVGVDYVLAEGSFSVYVRLREREGPLSERNVEREREERGRVCMGVGQLCTEWFDVRGLGYRKVLGGS